MRLLAWFRLEAVLAVVFLVHKFIARCNILILAPYTGAGVVYNLFILPTFIFKYVFSWVFVYWNMIKYWRLPSQIPALELENSKEGQGEADDLTTLWW
jgi:hypothetical protein